MKSLFVAVCLVVGLVASSPAAAQDVAITNARIIVGSGQVIDSGTIVVRGGKIASIAAGVAPTQGLKVIDAKGMSAMPGFIDGHKHVNNFDAAQMKSLIEAGYTTVLAGGGPADANIALRDRIEKGEIVGPRIIAVGPGESPPDAGRSARRDPGPGGQGIKHTGEIGLTPEPAPPQAEIEVLKAIVDEAKKAGIQVNVHAVSSPAMVAAVDAGVTRLVHMPNKDFTTYDQAERVAQTGSIVAGLIAFGAPEHRHAVRGAGGRAVAERQHRAFPRRQAVAGSDRRRESRSERPGDRNRGRLHDRQRPAHLGCRPEPPDDLLLDRSERRRPRRARARAEVVQHRVLDGRHPPHHRAELRALRRHGRSDRDARGGKLADIILIDGNPTLNIYEMLKTKVVLKEGKVVVDKR